VLSGSFGRLSPSICSPSAAWTDNADRRCIRRATPSPSPDIDEDDLAKHLGPNDAADIGGPNVMRARQTLDWCCTLVARGPV
jgi:hypothetical protein